MNAPHPHQPALPAPPLLRRLACWLYEGVLLFGVVFIAGYLFSTLTQTRHALDNRHAQQGFMFLVLAAYFVWFWMKGQTLAMKTWHIRLVDATGQAVTLRRALLRYVLSWVWFLPPLLLSYLAGIPAREAMVLAVGWIAVWAVLARFQPQGQFWHDIWAGTRLVQVTPKP
ncbi:MAG TPA: RDD family protein [Macromonas sp.]|nr:RDD family protein [Macromonas sp.]